jgi:hypothetical protein
MNCKSQMMWLRSVWIITKPYKTKHNERAVVGIHSKDMENQKQIFVLTKLNGWATGGGRYLSCSQHDCLATTEPKVGHDTRARQRVYRPADIMLQASPPLPLLPPNSPRAVTDIFVLHLRSPTHWTS